MLSETNCRNPQTVNSAVNHDVTKGASQLQDRRVNAALHPLPSLVRRGINYSNFVLYPHKLNSNFSLSK